MLNLNKINPTGIWNPYIPTDHDVQVSHIADMLACASYSGVHKIEIRTKFLTGSFWEISERATAQISGTTSEGNSITNVINSFENPGLILAKDWPELLYSSNYPNITWDEYYTPVPNNIRSKGYKCNVTPLTQITSADQLTKALQQDTTWVVIKVNDKEDHLVVRLNQFLGAYGLGQYFDSYEVVVKDFNPSQPILSEWETIITPKIMTNARLVQNGSEWGFYIPATSETAIIDKAMNLGYPIPTLNNGQNVDWANVKSDGTFTPAQ